MTEYDVKRLGMILAVQARIEAMKAFNKKNELEGIPLVYTMQFFDSSAELESIVYKHDEQL